MRVFAADFKKIVKLVQPENYSKILGELWDVTWITVLLGARCADRFSCWVKRDPSEISPPRIQAHLGGESGRAASEHKIAARL